MGNFAPAGSADLHQRLSAFGGFVTSLCFVGVEPVTAVLLVLCVTVVLSKM
ncbi:hypothetical protein ACM792_14780 [Metapseudomonas otitidis]|uniref:hypothetical protein n=1 Tax=Metapseudomonas otitidis TaxID=319939 RepID=UPI0039FD4243